MKGRVIALLLASAMVAAACGGGGSKKQATSEQTTTSTSEVATTTTLSGETVPSSTTSSTATAAAGVTTTTAKSGSTATKKTTATTVTKTVTKVPTGGIGNVSSATTTTPNKDIQPGGTVIYAGVGPDTGTGFDPDGIIGGAGPALVALFDLLMYTDPSDGQVKGQTADSLVSTDALVWTLKLKPNIKFTDGTNYDADAVKYNWNRIADPNTTPVPGAASQAKQIQQMDVIDPLTLKITLKTKNAVFPQSVAQIPFLGSPTALQTKGTGFLTSPVGAGPFTLKEWVRDDHTTFARNPNYWNAPLPYVDQIITKPITDEGQRINTFLAGQANEVFVGAVTNAAQLDSKPQQAVSHPSVINGGIVIDFNTTKPPFNDIRARQAIAMAIDRVDYAKVVTNGLIEPLDSMFRHDSPFFDQTLVQQPYNPTQAQALFDQLAADTGGPLQFTLTTFPVQNYLTSAEYVQGILNKYRNVKVSITPEPATQHITNLNQRAFTAAMTGIVFVDPEPQWTGTFVCNAVPSPTGWCNTKFDADVADNKVTLDAKQRITDIKDAQRQFYAEVPTLFLERRSSWTYTAPNVQDYQFVNDGNPLVDRVWIKQRG